MIRRALRPRGPDPHGLVQQQARSRGLLRHRAGPGRRRLQRRLRPLPFAIVPREERDRVAAKYGLPRPYLLFLGGEKPHKNVRNVLRAFAQARRERALPHALVLAGPMPKNRSRVEAMISALELDDRGSSAPGVVPEEDLPGLFAGADAFLYPTLYEGFGLPVVEAMACGVPVLTSSTSALQEIAGGYAYLVDPMDVDAIARGIVDLATDPSPADGVRGPRQAAGPRLLLGQGGGTDAAGLRRGPGPESRAPTPGARFATRMKTAVVHDWLNGMRGGEKVLEAILPLVPEPTIFTLFHVPGSVSPAIETLSDSWPRLSTDLPFARSATTVTTFRSFRGRSSPSISRASTSSSPRRTASPKERSPATELRTSPIATRPSATPTSSSISTSRREGRALRAQGRRDRASARMGRGHGRDADALPRQLVGGRRQHPPPLRARVRGLPPSGGRRLLSTLGDRPRESFLLAVGALVPYKRYEVAIEAARRLGRRLVLVGPRPRGGAPPRGRACLRRLRVGQCSPEQLRDLYRTCATSVQPGEEDFGIAAVEALACGAPVVALGRGGARDFVRDGDNGALYGDTGDDARGLAEALTPRPERPFRLHSSCGARPCPFRRRAFRRRVSEAR